ncbi:hypothetical protein ScalyP_jg4327 [Parmales sp. scaly parma]|nr:hypothetical protein ScalyP_jg4327 [Parmales sp. scaly parma]
MAAKVSDKIHAAFWVGLGIFTIVQSSLIPTMLNDPTVHRLFFNLAVICFTINCVLLGYLAVYLPCMRVTTPWDIYCPRVIPTVTIIFLVGGGCMMKALWPVYAFLTPVILSAVGMAGLFSLHFMPFLP